MTAPAKIDAPGVYDIPEADYHADPCPEPSLSSSIAKTIVQQSPLHAYMAHKKLNPHYESVNRQTYDLGSAAHDLLLGQPDKLVVIDAADWRAAAAKEARDEAYAGNKTPLLEHQMEDVRLMTDSARRQLALHEDGQIFLEDGCTSEQTLVWQEGKAWCRARVDRMSPERKVLFDYKTTDASAHPDEWGTRAMFNLGYDMQDAFYSRGAQTLFGHDVHFLFIVQERKPPYALSVISNTATGKQIGATKIDYAINQWKFWLSKGAWPGYPLRTAYVDPPVWQQKAWLDDPQERPSTVTDEMKRLADEFQRPMESAE